MSARNNAARENETNFDAAAVAVAFFGGTQAAMQLEGVVNLIGRMRAGEALEGKGAANARLLTQVANEAKALAANLRKVSLHELLPAARGAKARGARSRPTTEIAGDPPLLRDTRSIESLVALLERLATGLAKRAARQPKLPRGRPETGEILAFGVEALLGIWKLHRSDAPTRSGQGSAFAGLAVAVLTACGFPESAVLKAVRPYVEDPGRSPARKQLADAGREPTRVLVVLGRPHDALGIELARQYAEEGCAVTLVTPVALRAAAALPAGVEVVLDPKGGAGVKLNVLTTRPRQWDAVLASGFGAASPPPSAEQPDGLGGIDDAAWADEVATRPLALHRLLDSMLRAELLAPGARVVVVGSHHGAPTLNPHAGGHAARAAMGALSALLWGWSRDVPADRLTVALVYPGWGWTEDGQPNRHSSPQTTADILRRTLARLTADDHGRMLDLRGSRVPVML